MLYGERIGEAYRDESGRYVYEVDEHHAYRTDRRGDGLWRVDYGPWTPCGFLERQLRGSTQHSVDSLGAWRQAMARYGYRSVTDEGVAR